MTELEIMKERLKRRDVWFQRIQARCAELERENEELSKRLEEKTAEVEAISAKLAELSDREKTPLIIVP